ncbi:retrovirus-related pol polyprotein from transposon TNT 1-94 [Tanacetum coccineum]|uniref:Retrovirus-related pol polyprotein from transposon TNT 1-94 n=1 Tax=Tanacetum coccineum TaxID=301880 RepID=A0ABQ4WFE4_9ASTR
MTGINKKQYIADVRVMNYLHQAIPNDIYNLVDACKPAQEMWERIKRLMYGSNVTNHIEMLVNIMDRNNVRPIPVSINTKFLNCLQPEWSKYVTMASKAKRAARNHDPLALIAHSNASSSQSHASPSYSHSPQPYYVTHPSSLVDYVEDYQGELQGDSQEDKLTTTMINQAVIQDDRVDIQTKNAGYGGNGNMNGRQNRNQAFNSGNRLTHNDESNQIVQRVPRTEPNLGKENVQCYNCNEKGHFARDCQKIRVRDAKFFREQMLLAMKGEAGSNLKDEENDFILDNSYGDETLEELIAVVIMMA